MKLLIMQYFTASCYFLQPRCCLQHFVLTLCSFLSVKDQVSHRYKTTEKLIYGFKKADGKTNDNSLAFNRLNVILLKYQNNLLLQCRIILGCTFRNVVTTFSCLSVNSTWPAYLQHLSLSPT